MDLGFLLGAGGGGVQMPDPVAEMARGYSLSNLARQNRAGRDEEQDKARMRQAQIDAAQGLALAQSQGWDSAIQQTMQKNPDAGMLLRKLRSEDEGVAVERDVKRSTATKNYADAANTTMTAKAKGVEIVGGMAAAIAQSQNPITAMQAEQLLAQARHVGTPKEILDLAPQDPEGFKQWATGLAAAATDPKAQAEIWKIKLEAPANAARDYAAAGHSAEQTKYVAQDAASRRMSAGAAASNAATSRDRLTFDKEGRTAGGDQWVNDLAGNRQVNKATGETRPLTEGGVPVAQKADAKRTQQATQALRVIEQAGPLIDEATGSYAGAAVDMGARVFGKSTDGANATAKLQALEGALMMAQPRMEGPQSNLDVQLYRQMAARIGDPTVPREQKKAALEEIKMLHERYSGSRGATGDFGGDAPKPKSAGGWSVKRVD